MRNYIILNKNYIIYILILFCENNMFRDCKNSIALQNQWKIVFFGVLILNLKCFWRLLFDKNDLVANKY